MYSINCSSIVRVYLACVAHSTTYAQSRDHVQEPLFDSAGTHVKTHKLLQVQTSCYKSVHKLSTSCLHIACSRLL